MLRLNLFLLVVLVASSLYLVRVQPPNKKEMMADDWRRGLR